MSLLTSVAFPTLHEFVRRSAGERRLNVTIMYQSPDQFAETTPEARIDLNQDRHADQEHQEACLDLSHTGTSCNAYKQFRCHWMVALYKRLISNSLRAND